MPLRDDIDSLIGGNKKAEGYLEEKKSSHGGREREMYFVKHVFGSKNKDLICSDWASVGC
jgi:hypothetical protein